MKIAFTHPYCWPYVRRGNERNMDVMSRYFARQGHEVTTVSSRPGRREIERGEFGTRILASPVTIPGMSWLNIEPMHTFGFTAWRELRKLDVDVVHSLMFSDALAATRLAERRRFATVFQMNGVGLPGFSCRRFPPEAAIYHRVLATSDVRISCSEFVRGLVLEHYHADSIVIPPMVDVSAFAAARVPRAERPILIAAGDFTVPRKGIRVLLEAFPLVKREQPELILNLSGRMPEAFVEQAVARLPERWRGDVRLLGLGKTEDLPGLYAEANVLVLPAMSEPSGTVLMEAWAAGTPVVTTDHGGVAEFVEDSVGVLFDPLSDGIETRNAEGLAAAILQALRLGADPHTATACRQHAERFSETHIGPRIESLYRRLM